MLARSKKFLNSALLSIGLAVSGAAAADPLAIQITDPNAAISGYPPPYALIIYDLVDSNTATFTITAYSPYYIGAVNSVAVNFASAITLGTISGTSACANPYSSSGGGNVSSFGTFNLIIDTNNGANCAGTSITFTVDKNVGTWANTADILTANTDGYLAAAHIFAGCTGTPPNRSCVVTGFAGGDQAVPPDEIPEPQTLALLGLGLLALASVRRRRQ